MNYTLIRFTSNAQPARYFSSKNRFSETTRISTWDMQSNVKSDKSKKQEGDWSFTDLGGAFVGEDSIGRS